MTPENIAFFKENICKSLAFEMFKNEIDQAQTVKNILAIEQEGDMVKLEEKLKTIKADLEALGIPKKKEDRTKKKQLELDLRGTQFLRDRLFDGRQKLFKEVLEYGRKNEALQEEIDFTNAFERGATPQLPYIEIDGTRYESTKDNQIALDQDGGKILAIANDATNHVQTVPKA